MIFFSPLTVRPKRSDVDEANWGRRWLWWGGVGLHPTNGSWVCFVKRLRIDWSRICATAFPILDYLKTTTGAMDR